MNHRVLALTLAGLTALGLQPLQAQGLRPSQSLSPLVATPALAPAPAGQRAADFIIAVVNSEPITNNEFRAEAVRLSQQIAQARRPQPSTSELVQVVMDRLINERAQLQVARETGIRMDDAAIDQAEAAIARQNQLNVMQLRSRIASEGLELSVFRAQLRDQLMLTRLREREVDARVRVSDLEVDQYLRELQNSKDPSTQEVNIAQVLVAVPDGATPEQVATLQAKAQSVLTRARAGEDFAALARELSESADRANGGQLGLRSADRLPPLFLEATQNLAAGELSPVIRSGAGFHVLKVIEKRLAGMTVTQNRARHILLRASPQLSETAARDKLNDFKRRIQAGQADFATLARENSQDGSAAQGGDLGWASPGQFVPEFEGV
jgi:peptidyl-prolyl cis-trans isomerase SurA